MGKKQFFLFVLPELEFLTYLYTEEAEYMATGQFGREGTRLQTYRTVHVIWKREAGRELEGRKMSREKIQEITFFLFGVIFDYNHVAGFGHSGYFHC